jgi:hypothetical protein
LKRSRFKLIGNARTGDAGYTGIFRPAGSSRTEYALARVANAKGTLHAAGEQPRSAPGRSNSVVGLMRLGLDGEPRDLVLDLEFSLLETADRVVVGVGSGIFFNDGMLERRMLGLQRLNVVHGAHRENLHSWLAMPHM